ncbi:MAG: type II secretion system protein [Alphaproteobacteria bacterium]|nr:type II secretion system protein [Alphaproteobacteria bacterium]
MTACPSSGQRQRGFTLLEMLVALTVLSFLFLALVQGVRTGLQFWDRQSRRIADTADLDAGTRVLRSILTTIPAQPAALGAGESLGFKGEADSLTLTGWLSTGLGSGRLADMTILLRGGQVVISWVPHVHGATGPEPTPTVTPLTPGVSHLEFAYWGRIAPNASATWLARWNGPELPELIRVRETYATAEARRWPDLIISPRL